jgi:hypothetical protein
VAGIDRHWGSSTPRNQTADDLLGTMNTADPS